MADLHDIRRRRARDLIRERFGDRQKDFAEAVGIEPNYVSRMISAKKAKGHKNIGEQLARQIEEACGLPKLWLDSDAPSAVNEPPPQQYGLELTPTARTIATSWDQLPRAGQEMIAAMMQQMFRLEQEHPDVAARVFTVPDKDTLKRLKEHERTMERVQRELRAKAVKPPTQDDE